MENKQMYNIFLIHMIRFLIFEISCKHEFELGDKNISNAFFGLSPD